MFKYVWVQIPLSLMKINREKTIRNHYTQNVLENIAVLCTRGLIDSTNHTFPIKSFKNICIHTGRSRGVLKKYKTSRLVLRSLIDKGEITGIKRSSW